MDWYAAQKLEYEHERLPKYDNEKERKRVPFENYYDPEQCPWTLPSATSSAMRGSANTVASPEAATEHSQLRPAATRIPEAATEHPEIQRLLKLANAASSCPVPDTDATPEAATEHLFLSFTVRAIPELSPELANQKPEEPLAFSRTFCEHEEDQEATRPWKKGKGTSAHKRAKSPDSQDIAG